MYVYPIVSIGWSAIRSFRRRAVRGVVRWFGVVARFADEGLFAELEDEDLKT
jgi:hypothetical protein